MRISAALIMSTIMAMVASNSEAALIQGSAFTYDKWAGGAYSNDADGSFSHCVISSNYANGTLLLFSIQVNGAVTIGFARSDWSFKPGDQISATIRIDARYAEHVTGVARLPTMVNVDFLPTDPIFASIGRGYVMTVRSQAGNAVFNLTDTFRALQKAQECRSRYLAAFPSHGAVGSAEVQKWITRNPWFTDPRFASQAQQTLVISNQMIAQGWSEASAAYWDELDRRIVAAGINTHQSANVATPRAGQAMPASPAAPPGLTPPAAPTSAVPPPPTPKAPNSAAKSPVEQSGTGFVISSEGAIVTNDHVVASCIGKINGALSSQPQIELRVVSEDAPNDLALLKAVNKGDALRGSVSIRGVAIKPGDPVIAIGYPFYDVLSSEFSVTTGIVSSLGGIGNDSRYLQVSAPVQPGNSGGPLLDSSGNLIGVVSEKLDAVKMVRATGSIPENVNFAIKTGALRDFLDKNVVSYRTDGPTTPLQTSDIAASARQYTLRISCLATPDQ